MDEEIVLTPAQYAFVERSVPGFGECIWNIELAGRAASQRYFVRISNKNEKYILIVWDSRDEDWDRFIGLGGDRSVTATLLPELYAHDITHGLILEEDLGDTTVKNICQKKREDTPEVITLYKNVLSALYRWHSPQLAQHPLIAARSMDIETFLWETNYFARYCVKDFCGCEKHLTEEWEIECTNLAKACFALPQTAIHRDFQSENILICDNTVRFVDFQGARLGPALYDVASLLFDPYCSVLSFGQCEELFRFFCVEDTTTQAFSVETFYQCAAQRLMQALGAYGNLSLHKGKQWYREFVPTALERLRYVISKLPEYRQMAVIIDACVHVVETKRSELIYR